MQEGLYIYERLGMKNEFLYQLRMYTMLIITTGDFRKVKDLLIDYRFMTSWEEEQKLGGNSDNLRQYTLHGHPVNKESALANMMALMQEDEEHEGAISMNQSTLNATTANAMLNEKGKVIRVNDKKYF